jgi:hypothetical protein
VPNSSLFPTLFRFALRMKAIRQVSEGVCKQCEGTGAGEALADLGEALSRDRPLPIRDCRSCSGTGMAVATTKVTTLGRLLLFPIAAAMYQNRQMGAIRSTTVAFPDVAGPPTLELLSLSDALDADTPTVAPDKRDLAASIKRSVR